MHLRCLVLQGGLLLLLRSLNVVWWVPPCLLLLHHLLLLLWRYLQINRWLWELRRTLLY